MSCVLSFLGEVILLIDLQTLNRAVYVLESESVSHPVMSSSWQPHGLYLARLLCPWDFPGKNIGMGSHSLLRRISWPRDLTQVPCIAARFLTIWAIRHAHVCSYWSTKSSSHLLINTSLLDNYFASISLQLAFLS